MSIGFYIISLWYKREEAQQRFTIYWCSVLTANMFGGLLASAIAKMDGVRGMSSWRWIFVLEGLATIVIGCASYPLIPDFPEDARWLSQDEKDFIITRAGISRQQIEPINIRHIARFFADIKNIAGGLMYFGGMSNPSPQKRSKTNGFS